MQALQWSSLLHSPHGLLPFSLLSPYLLCEKLYLQGLHTVNLLFDILTFNYKDFRCFLDYYFLWKHLLAIYLRGFLIGEDIILLLDLLFWCWEKKMLGDWCGVSNLANNLANRLGYVREGWSSEMKNLRVKWLYERREIWRNQMKRTWVNKSKYFMFFFFHDICRGLYVIFLNSKSQS